MDSDSQIPQQGPALGVGDVLYILFRHKWKILFFTLLGVGAAVGVWFLKKPVYESHAKIWIRYVAERRGVNATGGEADVVREPEVRGLAVVNSEVEILTSVDSVLAAVRALGGGRVLQAYGGGTNEHQAAGALLGRLKTIVGSSGVVTIELGHPDPEIAREALTEIISAYRKTHLKIHRSSEAYDDLQAEADRIRASLARTEDQLRSVKSEVNVISLDDTKQELSAEMATLRSSIFGAEAELAERQAHLDVAEKISGLVQAPIPSNGVAETSAETNHPPEKIESYRALSSRLVVLQKRAEELTLGGFSETSRPVQQLKQQTAEIEKAIADLGIDPARIGRIPQGPTVAGRNEEGRNELDTLRYDVLGLQARIGELTKQRQELLSHLKKIEEKEDTIRQLERKRAAEDDKLRKFESNIDKARVDQAIDSSKLTNITVVQEATPAGRNMMKLYKMMGMALFGMVGAGIALGFVIDMFLDGSLKRTKDVEQKARVPVFVTIPQFGVNGRPRLGFSRKALKNGAAEDTTGLVRHGEIVPWDPSDPMFEYYEALRDRVVMSYEGDPRKPKIVAVTSCNRGAGTSRIATGLAAALSRDVQRSVLYIGLEKNKVAISAFSHGRPASNFAEGPTDDNSAPLGSELVALSHFPNKPDGASIVQTFSDMMPKLRTSDYDYVIFDLPPVSETTGSLRLASQIERTLLVVESEETSKAKVDRVRDLLTGTGTQLYAVLNKTRTYGPQFLANGS
ncbi:MAG TPA: Wzz/FepE/Etk N-terminal domain-containing protein [Verrucomicrobiae bacterium]